jgi:hypothetical protein
MPVKMNPWQGVKRVRKRTNMNKHNIIRFLQAVVAIPVLAVTSPALGVTPIPGPAVVLSQNSVVDSSVITTQEDKVREEKAAKIEALLKSYNSPLQGHGLKFVEEADKNNIDYRLLVAIAGRESTFAINACKRVQNSFLGYGSCKISFKSTDEAIERVSASLGGNDIATAKHYGGDKTTAQILRKYNSVIKNYPSEVIRIMKKIDPDTEII